jgi:hypothetical protein
VVATAICLAVTTGLASCEKEPDGTNPDNSGENKNPAEIIISKGMIEYEPVGQITADIVRIIVCFDFTDGNQKFRKDIWVSPPDGTAYHVVVLADDIAHTYATYSTLTASVGWADQSNNGTVASNAKAEETKFDRKKYEDAVKNPDAYEYALPDEVIAGYTCNAWHSGSESAYLRYAGYGNIKFKEVTYLNGVLKSGRVAVHFSETVPANAFTKTVNVF